jgi:hypothetical protein
MYNAFKEKHGLPFQYFEMYEKILIKEMCDVYCFYKYCLKWCMKCFITLICDEMLMRFMCKSYEIEMKCETINKWGNWYRVSVLIILR